MSRQLRELTPAELEQHQRGERPLYAPLRERDNEDAEKQIPGAGAVVVPAVIAFALACAALIAFLGGKL